MKRNHLMGCMMLMLAFCSIEIHAQTSSYNIENLIQKALENNSQLKLQKMGVEEKKERIKEAAVKLYPAVMLNADYNYNFKVGNLTLPAGSIDFSGPNSQLPKTDLAFPLGEKNNFSTGITVYQPITQLSKIKTGINIEKVEKNIAELQAEKLSSNISLDIKKLYYSILGVRKRMESAGKKIEMAERQLYDIQSTLSSGKTIQLNEAGLKANLLKEQQELLKLSIKEKDLLSDLQIITGIETDEIVLDEASIDNSTPAENLDFFKASAEKKNFNHQLNALEQEKLKLAIKATNQSFRPELGLVTGFNYQTGNSLMPSTSPFVGLSLRWNIQDLFTNTYQRNQRSIQYEQVKENSWFIKKQTTSEVEKVYRKLQQSSQLVDLAKTTMDYRIKDLDLEKNKRTAGLNLPLDIIKSEFMLTEAKADYYEAKLNQLINYEELKTLSNIK